MNNRLKINIPDRDNAYSLKPSRKALSHLIMLITITFSALASPAISEDQLSPFPLPKARVCENQNCLGYASCVGSHCSGYGLNYPLAHNTDCQEKNNVYGASWDTWRNDPICARDRHFNHFNINTETNECAIKRLGLKPEETCDWSSLENCATDELIAHNEEHEIISIFYTFEQIVNSGQFSPEGKPIPLKNTLLDHIETLNASGEPIYHTRATSTSSGMNMTGINVDTTNDSSIRSVFVDIQETVVNLLHPNIRSARFNHASPFLDRNIIYRFDYKQCNSCTAQNKSTSHDTHVYLGRMHARRPIRCPRTATFELPTEYIDDDLVRVARSHPLPFVIPIQTQTNREENTRRVCFGHKDINLRIEDEHGIRKYYMDRVLFTLDGRANREIQNFPDGRIYKLSLHLMESSATAPWDEINGTYDYSSLPITPPDVMEIKEEKNFTVYAYATEPFFRYPLHEIVHFSPVGRPLYFVGERPSLLIQFD